MEKTLVLHNVDVSIRKTNKPYWPEPEKFKTFSKKQLYEKIRKILNKYGRVSKGSYQYSIKVFENDILAKKVKQAYTVVSNWRGTLGEVEMFMHEHIDKYEFADDLIIAIEKTMRKKIKK